ncbi:MAG TPA: site-specific integrase [Alphaproteobacteria bacterium]|nr:site-specific integrase [Alphaproteobacteria bacterium]
MMIKKQAKILSDKQQKLALTFIQGTRYPLRNKVIFLLSVKAGLRAKEISCITWSMISDSQGQVCDALTLQDNASKGKSGRIIWLSKELKDALIEYKASERKYSSSNYVITSERSEKVNSQIIVNFFGTLFKNLQFEGASSHSGRRTFITNAARKITSVGGSLRDVQQLAGHSSLSTTQRYIEFDSEAMKKVVELV